ncbi:geobacillin-26 family protein [Brevibacillus laterosporus]|uniref:geobacillin-26 family protein n=1 Tax=Brevibacillus laterosporus TaxID=1465 RepID=UPI001443F795|nr:geobacillin-26 family protein [Brevibacillus laterosporus]NKQ20483.1 geobacillin-26 family protein [Brevibacillus laterosporus]WNX32618.1 geobacillin-26 family protein [Brevibacillus laterosporus]
MLNLKKNLLKITSSVVMSTFAFTIMLAPVTAAEQQNIEYVKTMNEELKKLDEFAKENVQIEYIKEDEHVRETKVTTDSEVVVTRLYKETNELEIETNGEKAKVDLDDYSQKKKSEHAYLVSPDVENSVASYDGRYEFFSKYYKKKNFWIIEWQGKSKTTFENSSNSGDLGDFAETIDELRNLEDDLDTAIAYGVPGVGFSAVIAAICLNPPLALTVGIMAGIAATYALTQACLNIMNDMIPHEKKAARVFKNIDPETP